MSTETNEFAVPEVVGDGEKDAIKEIKATKRPAEVSILIIAYTWSFSNSDVEYHDWIYTFGGDTNEIKS